MHKITILLLAAATTISLTTGSEILFSENHVKIIAKKNLTPISLAYKSTGNTIAIQIARAKIQNPNDNKIIMQCTKSATDDLLKAYKKIAHIFKHHERDKRHIHTLIRVKRGINVLGELLSDITGNPSPSEFKHLNDLVKDLESVSNDEINSIKNLHDIQEVDHQISQQNVLLINKVNSMTLNNKNKIENDENDLVVCDIIDNLVDDVDNEAEILLEIESKSTNFLPSRNMFPQKRIEKTIHDLAQQDNLLKPYFLTGNKIEEFYSLKSTVTSIHEDQIISIAIIPMINPTKTMSTKPMTFALKINKNILTIEAVAKSRLTRIATDPNERFFNLISEQDLDRCNKIENKNKYICDHRFIEIRSNQLNSQDPCLAYETDTNNFVLTCETRFIKKCDETSNHMANFSLISLPDSCSLDSDNIYIHKHTTSKIMIETSFQIVKIPPQLFQTQVDKVVEPATKSNLTSDDLIFKIHNKEFLDSFNKTIMDNHKLQKDKLNEIHSTNSTHSYITFTLIALIILVLVVGCCYRVRPNIPFIN